jgi:tRNA threonylcarbamoyladenosine biosynthesis protein TsaB
VNTDLILAIETSSLRGSVALGRGGAVLGWRTLAPERKHTTELLPAIRGMLADAACQPGDVGVVAFSQGPGSFTGLRVAATVARMWQSAVGSRVVGVPTLEVIARNALTADAATARDGPGATRLAVMLDARRGQVFGAVYLRENDAELRTLVDAALHDAAPWLATLEKPCCVLGEGVQKHPAEVAAAGVDVLPVEFWVPDARQVLAVGRRLAASGRFCTPEEIVPAYLRPPECEEVYEQRRAEARQRRAE